MYLLNPLTGQLDLVNQPYDPASDSLHVLKAGDTMTGALAITPASNGTDTLRVNNTGGSYLMRVNTTANFVESASIRPKTSLTYSFGDASLYWSNAYAQRYNLNSTAYLDGSTNGQAVLTTNTSSDGLAATNSISGVFDTRVFSAYAPNLNTGHNVSFRVGVNSSALNAAKFSFSYVASGSNSNGFTLSTGGQGFITVKGNTMQFTGDTISFTPIFSNPSTISIGENQNIKLGTTTGTKFGTAASQMQAWWGATPVVQPTTAITADTLVANTSGIADDTATFGGYTIGQVVAALKTIGLLA